MNNLRIVNEHIYNEYLKFNNIEKISSPLLVSSKRFLNNIKEKPIMYIGQETHGWINDQKDIDNIKLDDIENYYDSFIIDHETSKSPFWQFIKKVIDDDYSSISKNVIWTNTLIVGKRFDKGSPNVDEKLAKLSLEYLLFIYKYFEPSLIINVSGNTNPYYKITKEFLEKINSNIKNTWPTTDKPLIIDNNSNIAWTYHPRQLRYQKIYNDSINEIKKLI